MGNIFIIRNGNRILIDWEFCKDLMSETTEASVTERTVCHFFLFGDRYLMDNRIHGNSSVRVLDRKAAVH